MPPDDGTPWGNLDEDTRIRWRLSIPCDLNGCGAPVGTPCAPMKDASAKDLRVRANLWCLRRRVLAKQAWYAAPECYICGVRVPEAELEDHEDGCGV